MNGPRNGLGRPAWTHFGLVHDLLCPVLLPESSKPSPLFHVGPYRHFLSELDEAPYLARFCTFLARSSEFSIFSGLVLGLLGVVFTSLFDFYRASRSFHEVLNELIPEVLLSTLKPCTNTTLQNRHAQVNLLYHGGKYQWIRYKTYANTEGKLMTRLAEFHRQHRFVVAGHRKLRGGGHTSRSQGLR
jgi:hypothetical protein